MKFAIGMEICVGIVLTWSGVNALASLNENPYRIISVRNPFGLRAVPIEKVIEKPHEPAAPAMEIKLTGVARFSGGSPRAFLEFFDPQTKKTDRPSPFREGDRYNEHIQILSIDAALGLVRINKDGSDLTLDFEKDGIKEGTSASSQPRNPVAAAPPSSSPGGRLVVNPGVPSIPTSTASAPLTREELLARISAQRALQQQNPSTTTISPPPPASRTP